MAKLPYINLSDAEKAAITELENHPVNWIAGHCQIIDKGNNLVPLEANVAQIKIARIAQQLRKAKRPVKLIVLKARQEGVTTWSLADMYRDACIKSHRFGLFAAHDTVSSERIFQKAQLFQTYNTEAPQAKYSNRRELMFAEPLGSTLWVATAGTDDLGRGGTVQYLHCSELAFWPDATLSLTAALNCIPSGDEHYDTTVIMESTANGIGGEFYDRWCRATPCEKSPWMRLPQGKSDYVAVFLPWHTFPEYRAKPPKDFAPSDEEKELAREYGLDYAQLWWRRMMIDRHGGDEALFAQEFCGCDLEAFLVSGRPVFHQPSLELMLQASTPPRLTGCMQHIEGEIDGEVATLDGHNEYKWVEVWEEPRFGEIYAIGADTAEGRAAKNARKPEEADANSAHVIKISDRSTVAKISGRFDPDLYGEQLYLLGMWYNQALLGAEVNNTSGGAVRTVLRRMDYPNLYYREIWSKTVDKLTDNVGWWTDQMTRGTLIAAGREAIRQRSCRITSKETLQQMRCFVYDHTGKATAAPGEHDDDVMSWLIAWQMMLAAAEEGHGGLAAETGEYANRRDRDKSDPDYFAADMVIGGREADVVIVAGVGQPQSEGEPAYYETE